MDLVQILNLILIGDSMKIFQKIQLLSSIIPNFSVVFVFLTTFVYCCKRKKDFIWFSLVSIFGLIIIGPIWKWIEIFDKLWLSYMVIAPLVLVFNLFMVKIQIKE